MTCTGATTCQSCSAGFKLNNKACDACKVEHCLKCEKDVNKCEKCHMKYFVKEEKKCEKCPSDCLECENEGKCTKCADGFSESGGECTKFNWKRWLIIGGIICYLLAVIGGGVAAFLASRRKRGGYKQQDDIDYKEPDDGAVYPYQPEYQPDYQPGGYDDYGYDDGGYDNNGYDDGGYDDGGYNDGGYNDGGYNDYGYNDGTGVRVQGDVRVPGSNFDVIERGEGGNAPGQWQDDQGYDYY